VEEGGNYYLKVATMRRLNHKIENLNKMIYVGFLRGSFAPLVAMCLRGEEQCLRQATKISIQGFNPV
jgi:hypothetical protein